jgi:hypothetical protein
MGSVIIKHWCVWAVLALVAGIVLLVGGDLKSASEVDGGFTGRTDGIVVVPVQVARDAYGLAMVDMIGKTLWVYEINSRAPKNRLRLLAARDWQYDQLLGEYSTGDPRPQQVRELLEQVNSPPKSRQQSQKELEELAQPQTD